MSARLAAAENELSADDAREEYLLANSGPLSFSWRRDWMKKIRIGSLCVALIGAAVLAAAIYGQGKKDSPAPPKIMHFGDEVDSAHQGMRSCGGVRGRPKHEGAPFVVRAPVR